MVGLSTLGRYFTLILPIKKKTTRNDSFPEGGGCPSGWKTKTFGNNGAFCYLFVNEEKTFDDADFDCRIKGAYISSVMNKDENDFLNSNARNQLGRQCNQWLGMMKNPKGQNPLVWKLGRKVNYKSWWTNPKQVICLSLVNMNFL